MKRQIDYQTDKDMHKHTNSRHTHHNWKRKYVIMQPKELWIMSLTTCLIQIR